MTKLKKPITITIWTVEEALCAYHRMNVGIGNDDKISPVAKWQIWLMRCEPMGVWVQMRDALASANIDPNKQPPAPLLIGNHEVEALPDGAIKVGCTTVDRATLEKVYAMSNDSMTKVEPEWPRYYEHKGPYAMWKAYSETEVVEVESGGKECSSSAGCLPSLEDSANKGTRKRYTTAQAAAILKGAK